jgi:hypothetical protein
VPHDTPLITTMAAAFAMGDEAYPLPARRG